jgi:N-acetylmuramoyl-L-alanine amidase
MMSRAGPMAGMVLSLGMLGGAATAADPNVGQRVERRGDEIVACGQLFHTTAPVVLWLDPGGYDAYRTEPRFRGGDEPKPGVAAAKEAENRFPTRWFGVRKGSLSLEESERARTGGWDLDTLRKVVDQFVIHFDARGTSRGCFEVLHDRRGLSVHFMLDLDGTIYQTLDLKEGAWHATVANSRSIGIEIANIGTSPFDHSDRFDRWYRRDPDGRTRILIPTGEEPPKGRDPSWVARPIRDDLVVGTVQGRELRQYDLTPEQYDSLIRLTATLCTLFPQIKCDYPRDGSGALVRRKLPGDELDRYKGLLGHYHVQTNKVDPGPAFQWDRVVEGARALMAEKSRQ